MLGKLEEAFSDLNFTFLSKTMVSLPRIIHCRVYLKMSVAPSVALLLHLFSGEHVHEGKALHV